jgi:hypothetical protein
MQNSVILIESTPSPTVHLQTISVPHETVIISLPSPTAQRSNIIAKLRIPLARGEAGAVR